MIKEDDLINLVNTKLMEIVFDENSFKIILSENLIFDNGRKIKEYQYKNYLYKQSDAKQNAINYAYFEIKNAILINFKDKKFETSKYTSINS